MSLADGLADPRSQIKETSHPPIPELSRVAWVASSNIDSARNETRPAYRLPPEVLALIINLCQLEQFEGHHSRAYRWVQLMLVSRMWKATILSFPSLWSKLTLNASISQSKMVTLVDRSGSHPLQVVIPQECSQVYGRSVRYKHIKLAINLLPRISQLTIDTCGPYDTSRVCCMFRGRAADQLREFKFTAPISAEFVLYAPRLRSLSLSHAESWPSLLSVDITHIRLESNLNPAALERSLKSCPRLKEITIDRVRRPVGSPGGRRKISLLPGVRLVITGSGSVKAAASVFALGSTNHLSITTTIVGYGIQGTPFLEFALPRDISCLWNLDGLTVVHLRLTDTEDRNMGRTISVVLTCSTADRETLHVEIDNICFNLPPDPTKTEAIPGRIPAITVGMPRILGYLRPLSLGEVVELRMDGFVKRWTISGSELRSFLEQMPALRRITTSDDNTRMFSLALGTMKHSVVVERV